MEEERDPVAWTRRHWAEAGQPEPDTFAAMAALLRTHQRAVAVLEAELKAFDLTLTAFLLLTTLLMSRQLTRPLGQLSRHLLIHPTTVTLLIDQLERRELVKRSPHPSDRRIVLAKLTPAGKRLTVRAGKAAATTGFGLGPDFGADAAVELIATLKGIRADQGDPV